MATITLSNKHLHLIQSALDLYNRIGILQLDEITYHENIDQMLMDQFSPHTDLVVGDSTGRGEIVEIGKGFIKTKGTWANGEEIRKWTDIENVHHSVDYEKYHAAKDEISKLNAQIKELISGDKLMRTIGTSYGLGKGEKDYIIYDMIQAIRHEFWKANPDRSSMTVDSSVTKMGNCKLIKVEVDKL